MSHSEAAVDAQTDLDALDLDGIEPRRAVVVSDGRRHLIASHVPAAVFARQPLGSGLGVKLGCGLLDEPRRRTGSSSMSGRRARR